MAAFGPGNEPRFLFEASGTDLQVVDFNARERISAPFEVDLTLASEDEIQLDDVVGQPASLTVRGDDSDRYFNGIINQFVQTGMSGRFYLYQTRMVPSLWLLSLEQDCRIFQNKSTQDIVGQILEESGITADLFDFRLQNQCTPREYCVQYRETDLNFISRLLEEEGIFYFFEHLPDMHVMILGDSTVNYQAISGQANVVFNPTIEMIHEEEAVNRFILSRRIRSDKVTLRDFNFVKPDLDLTATNQGDKKAKLEVYDYPGIYSDEKIGKKLAQIRFQETVAYTDRAEGDSCCSRLTSGFTFNLTGHDLSNFNQEYLLAEVLHNGSQPQVLEEMTDAGAEFSYTNQFLAIPSAITFRPERTTPKPIVEGVQTAIVVGPKGEEIYTDEYGRVKVQFHWDRIGEKNENSSCWIRVATTLAGGNYGIIFTPRVGQEVMVDFVEGDPDKPIITGSVYNASTMPPYSLPDEKTKSTIKSNSSVGGGGFNEIRFDDAAGEEQLFIHAQKDQDLRVVNDLREWVGNESHRIVVSDQVEKIDGNKHLTVMGDHNEKINGTVSIEAGKDWQEKVGMKHALDAGQEIHLKAGMNAIIEAGTSITLKAGGGFIVVGPAGVTISGTPILLNSGGSAGSGSGCSPEAPLEPQEADKAKPGKDVLIPAAPAQLSPQALAFQAASISGSPFCET